MYMPHVHGLLEQLWGQQPQLVESRLLLWAAQRRTTHPKLWWGAAERTLSIAMVCRALRPAHTPWDPPPTLWDLPPIRWDSPRTPWDPPITPRCAARSRRRIWTRRARATRSVYWRPYAPPRHCTQPHGTRPTGPTLRCTPLRIRPPPIPWDPPPTPWDPPPSHPRYAAADPAAREMQSLQQHLGAWMRQRAVAAEPLGWERPATSTSSLPAHVRKMARRYDTLRSALLRVARGEAPAECTGSLTAVAEEAAAVPEEAAAGEEAACEEAAPTAGEAEEAAAAVWMEDARAVGVPHGVPVVAGAVGEVGPAVDGLLLSPRLSPPLSPRLGPRLEPARALRDAASEVSSAQLSLEATAEEEQLDPFPTRRAHGRAASRASHEQGSLLA